jgi:hypothetical protein
MPHKPMSSHLAGLPRLNSNNLRARTRSSRRAAEIRCAVADCPQIAPHKKTWWPQTALAWHPSRMGAICFRDHQVTPEIDICAQPCDCFAFLHFEGDALECWPRRALKWLDIRAYSGARWRIVFLQILQDHSGERRGILHRIFIAFPALQYKPYPGVRIWRRAVVNQDWETLQLRSVFGGVASAQRRA